MKFTFLEKLEIIALCEDKLKTIKADKARIDRLNSIIKTVRGF
jgi:hypothetical protein